MGFAPVSTDNFIKMHLKSNPSENEKNLREHINEALADYQKGVKCHCGNDIWVIGSAFVGNSCFTCITGESDPSDDYEIDLAVRKSESKKGRRHIDDIPPGKIAGFFDDDGYEINTDLIPKPGLCLTCQKNDDDDPEEELLCNMNRNDQRNDKEFKCYAYEKKC
jgi:hypothetical protein